MSFFPPRKMRLRAITGAGLAGLALLALGLTGCLRNSVVIPDQDTAEQQFQYAELKRRWETPPAEVKARKDFYRKHAYMFAKVIERFPDDELYVPLAIIAIAKLDYKSENYRQVVRYLEKALVFFPDNDQYQVRATFTIGRSLDQLKRYKKAKPYYRRCVEKYGTSGDKIVQSLVKECRLYYNKSYD